MNPPRNPSSVRPGFSLVEVTLAIGIGLLIAGLTDRSADTTNAGRP